MVTGTVGVEESVESVAKMSETAFGRVAVGNRLRSMRRSMSKYLGLLRCRFQDSSCSSFSRKGLRCRKRSAVQEEECD